VATVSSTHYLGERSSVRPGPTGQRAECGGGCTGSGGGRYEGGALRLISVSAIANNSASSTSLVSIILMASEAVTCGERIGGPGDVVGSVGAFDNLSPSCGSVEAAEDATFPERNSITSNDLAMTFNDLLMTFTQYDLYYKQYLNIPQF